jgi:hypothetical protein
MIAEPQLQWLTRLQFLTHIEKIAAVTLGTEPNCHAYAWFLSAGDNDAVPSHWLRGFEVSVTGLKAWCLHFARTRLIHRQI